MGNNLEILDGRGRNKIAVSIANKEIVKQWFLNNKGGMQVECQRDTGLSDRTVRKHLRAILSEQETT